MRKCESAFTVEWWPIHNVRPYPGNPREIPASAVAKVAASLKSFGWRQPIVVDRDSVTVVGHTRHLAALQLGHERVPVHVAADLTPEQARAYRLADNRVGEESRWDQDKLKIEFTELADLGVDLALTGFDAVEFPGLSDPDFAPLASSDVKPLDQTAKWQTCPKCGHGFEPC